MAGEESGRAFVEVDHVEDVARPTPAITVALGPPKGDRLKWAVQKLAELGVDRTVLLHSERSVRGWQDDRSATVVGKLHTTAREAAMQSRQAFIMRIENGGRFEEWLASMRSPAVVLWEEADDPLGRCFPPPANEIALVVGPEGGFSESEVAAARRGGAGVASLGSSILRTETAAVVGATLALAHYGRLG